MESEAMISYHNSGLGWTNEWYEKLEIKIPRLCHKYLNVEFIRKIYGNIVNADEDNEDVEPEFPTDNPPAKGPSVEVEDDDPMDDDNA